MKILLKKAAAADQELTLNRIDFEKLGIARKAGYKFTIIFENGKASNTIGSSNTAIGHGAQLLISAGALDGRRVTCSPGIRDDVRAAGAGYRDEAVVLDGNLLTGRGADDLPEFNAQLVAFLNVQA